MRHIILALSLLTACSTARYELDYQADIPVDCTNPVATTEGDVLGKNSRTGKTCEFLGVPFAAEPTGDLRFSPPEPPAKRSSLFKASTYGDQCLQKYGFDQQGVDADLLTVGSEDCLKLNIWSPGGTDLPVMVFIHGGAFTVGAGSWGIYEGDLLAQEDVVVVTINYRLGPFGFLAYPDLVTESGTTGNQGILDQIRALEWVRDNAAAFGGNPENVTIFGESAGGMSVCTLLASPMAEGLFHAAIMESGGCKSVATLETGYGYAAQYTTDTGCHTAVDPLACMRDMDAEALIEKMNFDIILSALEPHLDGAVLPKETTPLELLREGNFNKVPLLAGSNQDEVMITALLNPYNQKLKTASFADFEAGLKASYGVTDGTELATLYGPDKYETPYDAWAMLKTDYILACGTLLGAEAVAEQGAPVWHYIFGWDDLGSIREITGSMHGLELFFVFGTFDALTALIPNEDLPKAHELSKKMRRIWANFAKHHDPSAEGVPEWPQVGRGSMLLDTEMSVDTAIKRAECAFWDDRLPMGMENATDNLNLLVDSYQF